MTAEAYLQSTKLAEKLGRFEEFNKNKFSMLEVINMHRRAAKKIPARNGLETLVETANKKWEEVALRGQQYGFRNSQVTLIAPTGTIGFMMDCTTTGCEPDYALKKHKELAGGGSMTMVNQTVPLALEKLGYDPKDIAKIQEYIETNGTIEGSDVLREEHLPVFDCSVSSGKGVRFIDPLGHIKMLGAISPHISGAISKTVNCPENTTVEEIENLMYQGWKQGVKAVAIFRNGSKAAQPLRAGKKGNLEVLARGQRESLPQFRTGKIQKVKVGGTSLFITAGEYPDGRLGEVFLESLERGSEVNRLLNENAVQFSEKLQIGMPLREAIEIFGKAGHSQISGLTDHPFIKTARGIEGFLYDWIRAHYLGDIEFAMPEKNAGAELRPLPWELRAYEQVPPLHLIPTVAGEVFYPGAPSLEETIKKVSGTNFWLDEGLDTRQTIEKIKRTRLWKNENTIDVLNNGGRMTGQTCKCGSLLISDGRCLSCPKCKTSSGGCGG